MTKSLHTINPGNCDVPDLIVTIPNNLRNMIITKSDGTKNFFYKVDELRALPGHVLRASRVQVPEDNLDYLHWTREEDREYETADPQFLLGSKMLEGLDPKMLGSSLKLTDFATLVLPWYTLTSGLGVITSVWLVSLGGIMGLEVILLIGQFIPLIVKVFPIDCDPLALVEVITPVEDNKGSLVVCLLSNAACFCVVLDDSLGS
ncbi:hypothetical protein Tco_0974076 [Tanacetum coccineum]|uniref:Uncharacterized protein n=1 Tax=Tanacetum coccineum TaxID=301880 RepID=A0ABQ5EAL2_9ASTR